MAISKLGVLGAGAMGAGIAQISAQAGLKVVLVDIDQKFVDRGLQTMNKNWEKDASKGKITQEDKERFLGNIQTSLDKSALKDCELVIEAIIENIDIKKQAFRELGEICSPSTVLATNTSGLSITEIGAASGRPDRVVGMHFFNPVPVMRLVEVIPGEETTEETVELAMEVSRIIGKTPIRAKEAPGFIVNRLLVPYLNDAAHAYQEGVASAEDIDLAMKLGANMPIGPLALCDLVGIDVLLMVVEHFYKEFGDPKFRPALALKQKVRAGHFGVKTGKGFFDYTKK
ncbi:MAG TPA: 3-hydroxybutyryl-CoA dehydrogenase [Syntrophothermus lipocalidus]|uniref:3-hydroxybutyryl-CoA dehydrogenase n=1 Tax=Syntrophothermus lipocalidus (strain DSM 12680 / TGB-C1) TaxID=643648 RepID=D7CMS6_SYNLT|nr:3-hydroxyacyl-CoA dehydrogenase NAD-binding domain-containing protein [Syntrophothermus lipocalidus]ADI02011.1 3-hydroxyacyl-CoA dehydrogenase NAD-binding protein [Syntrophothermus lipocalidus DSM 12680]HHV76682.1 3-hydroxybutyryl-CoA dehydrogenase [Syntrophothermus lipocalidus]